MGVDLYWVFHCIGLLIFETSLKVYFCKLVTSLYFFFIQVRQNFWKNALMHKSEPISNSTLITHADKVYKFKVGTTRTHRSTDSLKFEF